MAGVDAVNARWRSVPGEVFAALATRHRVDDPARLVEAWKAEVERRSATAAGVIDTTTPLALGGTAVPAWVCDRLLAATGAVHVAHAYNDGSFSLRREPVEVKYIEPFSPICFATSMTLWRSGADDGGWVHHSTTVARLPFVGTLSAEELARRASALPRRRALDLRRLVVDSLALSALAPSGPSAAQGAIDGEATAPERTVRALVAGPSTFSPLLHCPLMRSHVGAGTFAPVILALKLRQLSLSSPVYQPWDLRHAALFAAVAGSVMADRDPEVALPRPHAGARALTFRAWRDRDLARAAAVEPHLARFPARCPDWENRLAEVYSRDRGLRVSLARIEDRLVGEVTETFARRFGLVDLEAVSAQLQAA